jgi:hypothetical protein
MRPFLTIREKEPHLFYFVDRVLPEAGWREGQVNMFSWGSDAVIDKLNRLDDNFRIAIDNLGAVVRLVDRKDPVQDINTSDSAVVPVSLFCGRAPEILDSYEFVFRTNQGMSASVAIYAEKGTPAIYENRGVQLKSPFSTSIAVKAVNWPEGWYLIRLSVADPEIIKTVRFYHRSSLKNSGTL